MTTIEYANSLTRRSKRARATARRHAEAGRDEMALHYYDRSLTLEEQAIDVANAPLWKHHP